MTPLDEDRQATYEQLRSDRDRAEAEVRLLQAELAEERARLDYWLSHSDKLGPMFQIGEEDEEDEDGEPLPVGKWCFYGDADNHFYDSPRAAIDAARRNA